MKKEEEDSKRQAEQEANAARASAEGAQFACSQTPVNENDKQWKKAWTFMFHRLPLPRQARFCLTMPRSGLARDDGTGWWLPMAEASPRY